MKLRHPIVAAMLAVLLTAVPASSDDRRLQPFAGEAFGADGRLRYVETHTYEPTATGFRQATTYRDADGREIGRMEADYSDHRFAPRYRMIDLRHDSEEVVRRDGNLVHVEVREGERVRRKTLPLTSGRELIVGPGFNEFIAANWNALLAGETLVSDFVIPSRLQLVAFRIRHTPGRGPGATHRFTVSADNAFLRMLAPELVVEYDRETRALASYDGPSNVNDERNRSQTVAIRFPAARARDAMAIADGSPR
jgi:hypothetical protein